MSNYFRAQAVYATHSNAKCGDDIGYYDENDDIIILDETKITAKQKEIENLEAIKILREERNKKLMESDWTQNRDVTLSNDTDWKTYRQTLRDLPSTASPKLDDNINLSNVTWPTKPS